MLAAEQLYLLVTLRRAKEPQDDWYSSPHGPYYPQASNTEPDRRYPQKGPLSSQFR